MLRCIQNAVILTRVRYLLQLLCIFQSHSDIPVSLPHWWKAGKIADKKLYHYDHIQITETSECRLCLKHVENAIK